MQSHLAFQILPACVKSKQHLTPKPDLQILYGRSCADRKRSEHMHDDCREQHLVQGFP